MGAASASPRPDSQMVRLRAFQCLRIAFPLALLALVVNVAPGSAQRPDQSADPAISSAERGSTDAFDVFSVATGRRDPRFPRMRRDANHNSEVLAVIPDGSSGWFVGGAFGKSDGVPCPNLVHFRSDGKYDPRFCPAPNDRVVALLLSQGVLYVGGSFTRVGGVHRNYLAALDAETGQARRWNPYISGRIYYDRSTPIPRGVWALAALGNTLYIAGQFDSVAARPRPSVAALRFSDATPTAFRPPRLGFPHCSRQRLRLYSSADMADMST
jgi:hypothetical protein